ncbi:MAG: hypothetical protein ACKVVP_11930 [Chloroflexota bacterium]
MPLRVNGRRLLLPQRTLRLVLLSMSLACVHAPNGDAVTTMDCSRLADNLRQLVDAPDPMAAADRVGAPTAGGKVRVVAELEPDREVPPDLPGIIEAQYLPLVQVLIEPAQLCTLAMHSGVVRVRAPLRAVPQRSQGAGAGLGR